MNGKTEISWCDATWELVTGCSPVSAGCANCYAARMVATRLKNGPRTQGLAVLLPGSVPRWTGEVRCHPDQLDIPLRRKTPTTYFVCSRSDLYHPDVPFEFIDRAKAVESLCPQHTFIELTKRPERMEQYHDRFDSGVPLPVLDANGGVHSSAEAFPLLNVRLGTSVENQKTADDRIPHLLRCPAAVRFVSVEPLLGPIDFKWHPEGYPRKWRPVDWGIDYIIVGGESGPGARPMDIEWLRSLVYQCDEADMLVWVKQDSGPKPGQQGRIPDDLWRRKEWPA